MATRHHTLLTAELLRDELHYDAETGNFRRLTDWNPGPRSKIGVGTIRTNCRTGYRLIYISVCGKQYMAHRLAWLWITGNWPRFEIDHINGDPLDNRWINLRDVTRSENQRNMKLRKDNTSGTVGVYFNRKPWEVQVCGKTVGRYATEEEAVKASNEARKDWIRRTDVRRHKG